jgi:hypothetical protein
MISLESKPDQADKFKLAAKIPGTSLPASPDKDVILSTGKALKSELPPPPPPIATPTIANSVFNSKTNSMYGSDINIDTLADEEASEFDGLLYKDPTNSTNTLHMLNVLRKNRQLCDLILQLDDDAQDIYCHQLILACNSKFFMEIFNTSQDTDTNHDPVDDTHKSPTQQSQQQNHKKHSLSDFINKNHGANQRQILFCLSAYLRNFLSGSHHHYAKINSIINHNNHTYQKAHLHSSAHNIDMTQGAVLDDETINHINQNLDCQALKICIDYMYTSKLKVYTIITHENQLKTLICK